MEGMQVLVAAGNVDGPWAAAVVKGVSGASLDSLKAP